LKQAELKSPEKRMFQVPNQIRPKKEVRTLFSSQEFRNSSPRNEETKISAKKKQSAKHKAV